MALATKSYELPRIGPVHWQPFEMEIGPLQKYFRGRVLNAGCGHRDITGTLLKFGACEVVNLDIESNIPGAIPGRLEAMPVSDEEFDVVFSNAVLEHVENISAVMKELVRVLKRGGVLAVSIPFLQPFHADPNDYRRYTKEGLRELGEMHGLEVVEILPVHTIAQTLGWIAWEWALEVGGWRKAVTYPLIWIATRLSYRTDPKTQRSANTYQAIYRKRS